MLGKQKIKPPKFLTRPLEEEEEKSNEREPRVEDIFCFEEDDELFNISLLFS